MMISPTALLIGATVLKSATELAALCAEPAPSHADFSLRAQVTFVDTNAPALIAIRDASGCFALRTRSSDTSIPPLQPGDSIRAQGTIAHNARGVSFADCRLIEKLSSGQPILPTTASAREIHSGKRDYQLVRVSGTVGDIFRDEIDPDYVYLVLRCEGRIVYVALPTRNCDGARLQTLLGTTLSIQGICFRSSFCTRRQIGRIVLADGTDALQILSDPAAGIFDCPDISALADRAPDTLADGFRFKTSCRVLSVWGKGHVLAERPDGEIVGITLADAASPAAGQVIEAVGYPETDLYRINLARAFWRPAHSYPTSSPTQKALEVSAAQIVSRRKDRPRISPSYHGKTVRIQGLVRNRSPIGTDEGSFTIESDGLLISVKTKPTSTTLEKVEVGARVSVTGTCVMEADIWRATAAFPQLTGFFVVLNEDSGLEVLARPPWLTPGRMLTLSGSFLLLLAGMGFWTVSLRRLAERRGRQLAHEQIARSESELKVQERTRLAVELHDSLAQNLTGISMELDAAGGQVRQNADETERHLTMASRTLKSCRDELRNCLWDLRSRALEEDDMNAAILTALRPHVGHAALTIRFNVSRRELPDDTAHAFVRIIRELATNAIRHGHASQIRIAGIVENGLLRFSVSDNGDGFDTVSAPGIQSGHFGLQGIRERVKRFRGDFTISSTVGHGTKATITMKTPTTS